MSTKAILLSTFNGEEFLSEQLDSLINQKIPNMKVYIRDDGSYDSTPEILINYQLKFPELFEIYLQKNIGSSASFFWLLENVTADYYFFCDQDDVWLPNKLKMHLSDYTEKSRIQLVFSDMMILGKKNDATFLDSQKMNAEYLISNPLRMICQNCIAGCSMSINYAARINILNHNNLPEGVVHDHWISILTALYGEVIFLKSPLVFYRNYGSNQIGINFFNIKYFFEKVLTIHKTINHDFQIIKNLPINHQPSLLSYIKTKIFLNIFRIFVRT